MLNELKSIIILTLMLKHTSLVLLMFLYFRDYHSS